MRGWASGRGSVLLVLVALFVALTVKQIDIHPQLGVDEIYFFDYALKSPSLGIRVGEQVGTEAMAVAGCRGIEVWPEELIPACGDPQPDPNQLWQGHRRLADAQDLPIHQMTLGESGFQWQQIDDELRSVFTPFRDQWIQTWDVLTSLTGVADIGLIVLMGTTVAVTANKSTFRYFTAGVVTAMVGFGVVVMLSTYGAGYNYFQFTPGRYGLALLPFAAIAVVPALRQIDLARLCTIALAAAICGALFYGVFTSTTATPDIDRTEAIRREHQERQVEEQERLIGEQQELLDKRERQIESQQQTISEQQQQLDEKESLLNQYRCQLGADLDQVPEGCE